MTDIEALFRQFIGRPRYEAYAMRLILGDRPPNRNWGTEYFPDNVVTTIIQNGRLVHHIRLEWGKDNVITSATYEGAFRV